MIHLSRKAVICLIVAVIFVILVILFSIAFIDLSEANDFEYLVNNTDTISPDDTDDGPRLDVTTTSRSLIVNDLKNAELLPQKGVCGLTTGKKILGGQKTELDDFPWMALLEYEEDSRRGIFGCGGSLINERYVLTAAHCVEDPKLDEIGRKLVSVRLGEYDTANVTDCIYYDNVTKECVQDPPLDIPVEEIIVHEKFNKHDPKSNDIALLRLAKKVKSSDYIKPICLPRRKQQSATLDGDKMYIAGWGVYRNKETSTVKLKALVPIVSSAECGKKYFLHFNLTEKHICAGGQEGVDSCQGDSGGPLMKLNTPESTWYAVGIVSFGPTPCGLEGRPAIYTRVSSYMAWIVGKLKP